MLPDGGELGCDGAHHVAPLIGAHGVRGHIGKIERVDGGAPGEGDLGEVRSDLGERAAVLGAVSDHEVVAVFGIAPDRRRCVFDDEAVVGDVELDRAGEADGGDRVDHALGEGEVVARARATSAMRKAHRRRCACRRRSLRRRYCHRRDGCRSADVVGTTALSEPALSEPLSLLAATCRRDSDSGDQHPQQSCRV